MLDRLQILHAPSSDPSLGNEPVQDNLKNASARAFLLCSEGASEEAPYGVEPGMVQLNVFW